MECVTGLRKIERKSQATWPIACHILITVVMIGVVNRFTMPWDSGQRHIYSSLTDHSAGVMQYGTKVYSAKSMEKHSSSSRLHVEEIMPKNLTVQQ